MLLETSQGWNPQESVAARVEVEGLWPLDMEFHNLKRGWDGESEGIVYLVFTDLEGGEAVGW